MQRTSEPITSRPETRAGAIDQAELQAHLDRAHELRAEYIAGLLRRGLGGLVRLLLAVLAPLRRKLTPAPPVAGSCRSIRPPVTTEPTR